MATGLFTGSFAAWAYYGDTWNYFAHTFGLWILAAVVVAARRSIPQAIASTITVLASAVVAFYVGKKVMYAVEYPGMPYGLNIAEIVQWIILSVIAGALIGPLVSAIGRTDRWGTFATAATAGLLVADFCRRITQYTPQQPAIPAAFTLLSFCLVLAFGVRSRRQLLTTVALTPAFVVAGFLLVGAPNALEQMLATGSITQALRMLFLGHA